MQNALNSVKVQLETEHQTLAAVQDELTGAQQQQGTLQQTLQEERSRAEELTRKVHSLHCLCTSRLLLLLTH